MGGGPSRITVLKLRMPMVYVVGLTASAKIIVERMADHRSQIIVKWKGCGVAEQLGWQKQYSKVHTQRSQ